MKSLPAFWLASRHPANKTNVLELLNLRENKMKARSGHFFTAVDRILSANFLVFHTICTRTTLTRLIGAVSHSENQKIRLILFFFENSHTGSGSSTVTIYSMYLGLNVEKRFETDIHTHLRLNLSAMPDWKF
jgi:hypothetical protein